jgi:hypothetical protein
MKRERKGRGPGLRGGWLSLRKNAAKRGPKVARPTYAGGVVLYTTAF